MQKLSATGDALAQWGKSGKGPGHFSWPGAVDVDSEGNVYVADTLNSRVQKLSPNGEPLAQWTNAGGSNLGMVSAVRVDHDGNILAIDFSKSRIFKLAPAGEPLASYGGEGTAPGQFRGPSRSCRRPRGQRLCRQGKTGGLQKLSPTGEPLGQWPI